MHARDVHLRPRHHALFGTNNFVLDRLTENIRLDASRNIWETHDAYLAGMSFDLTAQLADPGAGTRHVLAATPDTCYWGYIDRDQPPC